MVKSMRKNEFHPCEAFSTSALLRDGRYAKREFRAVQYYKDQLRDLYNYLNHKVITAINTFRWFYVGR